MLSGDTSWVSSAILFKNPFKIVTQPHIEKHISIITLHQHLSVQSNIFISYVQCQPVSFLKL